MFAESGAAEITDHCAASLSGEERSFDAVARASGHEVYVRTSPLRGEAGQIVGAMLIAQDVHERVERERAFSEAHERFRRAFENAPIGMAVTGLDGRYLEVNSALCAITGYTSSQLCARTFMDITHRDDVGAGVSAIKSMFEGTTSTFVTEKRYVRLDGDEVWVSLVATIVRGADGAPLHFLTQVQDVTERRRFESELRHLADHDPLTGLFNRRRFEQELDRHVTEVARYGPRGALLVLDLDHFKYVNDALGHHAGDELILSVAAILRARLRDSDILARLGGDEFAVLLPTADPGEAEHVAEDVLRAVRDETGLDGANRRTGVTTSIGVASFRDADMTGEELLIEADLAMYDAKEAGRDRYAVVAPETQRPDRIKARVSWLERIRCALDEDRFVLYAQPIRDLRTGEISQQELLVRMLGDSDELIPPAAFLPLAERFGLVPAIDRWVAGRAIELLAEDPDGHQSLEVNLSGPSLNDRELLSLIETEVRDHGIDPRRLIFEVTETAAVANIPLARRFAERLMQLGCRFALDDFGAGFGSFYYLKHLPFDYLKIDGEFVSGCLGSRTDQLIIESVVRIARGLGKETIAEFVSDPQLEAYLRSQGVDHAQGFHIGRPVPIGDAGRQLQHTK
jgi:diguanylate cyclase (GGDEF)-like protein/PAS domain S-box-containing protein